ncbi:hypothetical protein VHEMI09720 [[Torrubiella] hemipterigena]|nr:hypothetical protein VHEMI09720 [[Torrubiella] hemipterigena]
MLEKSLQGNTIVVMYTGSGKTQVAIDRIRLELERCEKHKLVWFLAPTVLLCGQQFNAINLQMPSVSMKILSSMENVHTWGPDIWRAILKDVRVIVSTFQVLYDALAHGFVTIDQLALIIFDEVHNCVGKHPGGKVMADFYHPALQSGLTTPAILGLTATPIMQFKMRNLQELEALMDSRCITPSLHRSELLERVKKPRLLIFSFELQETVYTSAMLSMKAELENLDIMNDPRVISLQRDPTDANRLTLEEVIFKKNTYSMTELRGLNNRSCDIQSQLGSWAADYFLHEAISSFLHRFHRHVTDQNDASRDERRYVADKLMKVNVSEPPVRPQSRKDISQKVILLLEELLNCEDDTVGIIFVRERATTSVMAALLSSFPQIRKRYSIGSIIGTSNFGNQHIYDLSHVNDVKVLQRFRAGEINLLIATSVLEEGIDVPACNLVVCFDFPATPKAFIQRRGRARMNDSKILMFTEQSEQKVKQWQSLEEEMNELYQDDQRERRQLEDLESKSDGVQNYYEVPTTKARLDYDNAKQHLDHFCSSLAPKHLSDNRPQYVMERHALSVKARVILPNFVPHELRQTYGKLFWTSEKQATKDAAFHALIGLHKAGLINGHLLPHSPNDLIKCEMRESVISVLPLMKPWPIVAKAWKESCERWVYQVDWYEDGIWAGKYQLTLPAFMEHIPDITFYPDYGLTSKLVFSNPRGVSKDESDAMADDTPMLVALNFGHRWTLEDIPQVIQLSIPEERFSLSDIGNVPCDSDNVDIRSGSFLIRDSSGSPCTYVGTLSEKPPMSDVQKPFHEYGEAPEGIPYVILKKWPRRTDMLHSLKADPENDAKSEKPYQRVLPLSWAVMDSVPIRHARFGKLIPSLIHTLGTQLIAMTLSGSLRSSFHLSDTPRVREAICARSANEACDYERLEFLGDAILKYCATIQAASANLKWPEGYLSAYKDGLVSNSRLCRAAVQTHLAQYIIAKPFTGDKWRPLYVEHLLKEVEIPEHSRQLSTKVLADVIESLIGVSYLEGGVSTALKCISYFISDSTWDGVQRGREIMYNAARDDVVLSPLYENLQSILDYTFKKPALLMEALTHASHGADAKSRSYDRLEFLGDAILDKLIVTRLFDVRPPLKNSQMHSLKTAMVNKDFLAFIILGEHESQESDVTVVNGSDGQPEIVEITKTTSIWTYMRHSSMSIGCEQAAAKERYLNLKDSITKELSYGGRFPWPLLARVHAPKYMSDLFESLLGAIWVDSDSLDPCKAMVERLGIMKHLDRMVADEVRMLHPKEEYAIVSGSERGRYNTTLVDSMGDEKEYACELYLGERLVVEVQGGVSREEAEATAAALAIDILEQERNAVMDISSE